MSTCNNRHISIPPYVVTSEAALGYSNKPINTEINTLSDVIGFVQPHNLYSRRIYHSVVQRMELLFIVPWVQRQTPENA